MNLTRYTPKHVQNGRHTTPASFFDELFDDFFGPVQHPTAWSTAAPRRHSLQVDVYEQEDAVVIEAEMPGIVKKDIRINVKGRQLTLGGERKRETEVKDAHIFKRERSYGNFERTFTLPFGIDTENVQATFTDGVLRIEIQKPADQQPQQITIN